MGKFVFHKPPEGLIFICWPISKISTDNHHLISSRAPIKFISSNFKKAILQGHLLIRMVMKKDSFDFNLATILIWYFLVCLSQFVHSYFFGSKTKHSLACANNMINNAFSVHIMINGIRMSTYTMHKPLALVSKKGSGKRRKFAFGENFRIPDTHFVFLPFLCAPNPVRSCFKLDGINMGTKLTRQNYITSLSREKLRGKGFRWTWFSNRTSVTVLFYSFRGMQRKWDRKESHLES